MMFVIHARDPRASVVHPGHHPQHGEVVPGLVALAAALVLVVDDVLADVAVDVLVTEGGSAPPVDGHHDDDGQDDRETHQDSWHKQNYVVD